MDSWTSFCGGYCPRVLTKTHVEGLRGQLAGSRARKRERPCSEPALIEGQAAHRARVEIVLRGCDRGRDLIGVYFHRKSEKTKEWESNRKNQNCKQLRQPAFVLRRHRVHVSSLPVPLCSLRGFPKKVFPTPTHPAMLCDILSILL